MKRLLLVWISWYSVSLILIGIIYKYIGLEEFSVKYSDFWGYFIVGVVQLISVFYLSENVRLLKEESSFSKDFLTAKSNQEYIDKILDSLSGIYESESSESYISKFRKEIFATSTEGTFKSLGIDGKSIPSTYSRIFEGVLRKTRKLLAFISLIELTLKPDLKIYIKNRILTEYSVELSCIVYGLRNLFEKNEFQLAHQYGILDSLKFVKNGMDRVQIDSEMKTILGIENYLIGPKQI